MMFIISLTIRTWLLADKNIIYWYDSEEYMEVISNIKWIWFSKT